MSVTKHEFMGEIIAILDRNTNGHGEELLSSSEIIQSLNIKTKAANRGSKSRASFTNHYAIYVLVEDYLNGGFDKGKIYSDYKGAKFRGLFHCQRELPFDRKLQNHALNHRLNEEFENNHYPRKFITTE